MCFFGVKTVVSYVIVIRETIRGAAMERMEVLRLYDHRSDEVYRLAYSYLMNRHDAQDIVQEVFLRLLEKNHSIKTESEDAFLARITINCCKDLLRKNKHRQYIPLDNVDIPSKTDFQDQEEIMHALMKIAPQYRIVIYLYYYVGYRPSEMAKILKLTESGVSMRMTRARRQLKLLLGEEAFNESFL